MKKQNVTMYKLVGEFFMFVDSFKGVDVQDVIAKFCPDSDRVGVDALRAISAYNGTTYLFKVENINQTLWYRKVVDEKWIILGSYPPMIDVTKLFIEVTWKKALDERAVAVGYCRETQYIIACDPEYNPNGR